MLLEETKMTNPIKITGFTQGLYQQSTVRKEVVGTVRMTQDGRTFHYALAGGTLARGLMTIGTAATANLNNEIQTVTTVAVGETQFELLVTTGTATVKDELKGGYLMVNHNDTLGACYEIASNEVKTSAATALFISLVDPIESAIAATAELCIHRNPWWKVTQSATEESMPTGIPLIDVTDTNYFWCQTGGIANVLFGTEGAAIGVQCFLNDGAAGSVGMVAATPSAQTYGRVGTKLFDAAVDTEYQSIMLQID
jgi:hypothetical protein